LTISGAIETASCQSDVTISLSQAIIPLGFVFTIYIYIYIHILDIYYIYIII
jgi:hypothetical protein